MARQRPCNMHYKDPIHPDLAAILWTDFYGILFERWYCWLIPLLLLCLYFPRSVVIFVWHAEMLGGQPWNRPWVHFLNLSLNMEWVVISIQACLLHNKAFHRGFNSLTHKWRCWFFLFLQRHHNLARIYALLPAINMHAAFNHDWIQYSQLWFSPLFLCFYLQITAEFLSIPQWKLIYSGIHDIWLSNCVPFVLTGCWPFMGLSTYLLN